MNYFVYYFNDTIWKVLTIYSEDQENSVNTV